ncbi:hybrid sensor histidine kinase/response regulator transcription factor [Mucilaginibacter defluvii]|uniref:histidine kinase n=1 Tax=Mucilaginibacter defluvii TaxID=1196019 RepID=A0ABP9FVQ6_9SPHI
MFVLLGKSYAQTNVQFTHLTTLNGLSQSKVNCILKDKLGFMWFGTQNGLNRYDGYSFKVYQHNLKDSTSIAGNNINCLFEDSNGDLWIGTSDGGLVLYDRGKDAFIPVGVKGPKGTLISDLAITAIYEDRQKNFWVGTFNKLNLLNRKTGQVKQFDARSGSLSNNTINCVYQDRKNRLWVGTAGGLNLLNPKTGRCKTFLNNSNDATSLSDNKVNCINQDASGNLWVGTNAGLNKLSADGRKFEVYKNAPNNNKTLSNNVVNAISNDGAKKLWVATESALDHFELSSKTFTHYQELPFDERSLSHSSVYSLLVDNVGILWVGTYNGGINKYDKNETSFKLYRNFNNENLNTNTVSSFAEEADGDVWVGTDGGGLYHWQRKNNWFTGFNPQSKQHYFPSLSVLALKLSADRKILWAGTYGNGLIKMDLSTMHPVFYNTGLKNNAVYTLIEDQQGNIWAGTNGGGVSMLDPATGKFKNYMYTQYGQSISSNFVRSLCEDADGNIWIGTYSGGLNMLNHKTGKFTYYNTLNSGLQSDIIYAIYQDKQKNIWVGTMGGGLHLFDNATHRFKPFNRSNGLAGNIINSISEDKNGTLWISTDNGINQYDSRTKKFKTFTVLNGLQGNEFFLGAGITLNNNDLLFGGLNGFNLIDPNEIKINRHIPPVVITDFLLFNKSVPVANKNSPLQLNINETREIELSHNQSVFTIEFAALNYTIPQKNRYAYRLEGFDRRWNHIKNERKVTYTNLDPGDYTFRVIASNNDGIWNRQGASIKIIIKPPFWKTNTAYLIYIAAIAGILYAIYREIVSREKLKSEIEYQKLTAGKIQELNQLKLNFFTNISHELRTPLSLIIDPIRKISTGDISVEKVNSYSALAYKNALRLMALVNQLLDFRKLESGNMHPDLKRVRVAALVSDVFDNFSLKANERNIQYSLRIDDNVTYAWLDSDKLHKILTNLLANAFKHTPDNGTVTVFVKQINVNNTEFIEIHVTDTGIGIPEQFQEKIFNIFYQVKGTQRFAKESSGIGLALTKELVTMHNGNIRVESEEGKGTDFIVQIPVGLGLDDEHENISEPKTEQAYEHEEQTALLIIPDTVNAHAPVILVVEDNETLRHYITQELSETYQVYQACDGLEGYEMALHIVPDLVISDILMPGHDGLELCHKLKTDEKTSHIPVILLTARQTEENRIEGYTTGADAYIAKPYNSALLKVRIQNILDSRKKLRELYSTKIEEKHVQTELSPIDKQFLKKAVKIVEDNIADIDFDIDTLAERLQMSRRQLYRKISALTDKTVHDFVTDIRMEKAATLLLSGEFTIAEVAYKVGFSEPANFSRSFSKKYGISPKNYVIGKSKL